MYIRLKLPKRGTTILKKLKLFLACSIHFYKILAYKGNMCALTTFESKFTNGTVILNLEDEPIRILLVFTVGEISSRTCLKPGLKLADMVSQQVRELKV